MPETSYAVIGGGVAGASAAYHLSQQTDDDIVVFERSTPGSETTYKSYALFGWYGDEVQYRMKKYAMKLYNEFLADARANAWYEHIGRLVVATTDEGVGTLRQDTDIIEQEGEHLKKLASGADRAPIEYIPSKELRERLMSPYIDPDAIAGALYRPKVGYVSRPHELAHEFLKRAEENGVSVQDHTRVTEINRDGDVVTGITTDSGTEYEADHVVSAAGPWNIKMLESLGLDYPIKHTLAPVLKFRPQTDFRHTFHSMRHVETGVSWRGNVGDDTVLVNNYPGDYHDAVEYDPDTLGETVPHEVKMLELETTEKLIPHLSDAEIVDEWVGIRSMTPDGNPLVGWTELEGLSLIAFNSSGIQLAPAAGQIVAEQLVKGEPTSYYEDLSISRFEGFTDIHGGSP